MLTIVYLYDKIRLQKNFFISNRSGRRAIALENEMELEPSHSW